MLARQRENSVTVLGKHYIFKGLFTEDWKLCHNLLTLKLFQTCMSFFLLLNTKEDILKNVGNQIVDFHSLEQLEDEWIMTEFSFLGELSHLSFCLYSWYKMVKQMQERNTNQNSYANITLVSSLSITFWFFHIILECLTLIGWNLCFIAYVVPGRFSHHSKWKFWLQHNKLSKVKSPFIIYQKQSLFLFPVLTLAHTHLNIQILSAALTCNFSN